LDRAVRTHGAASRTVTAPTQAGDRHLKLDHSFCARQATDTIASTVALADAKYGMDPNYKRWVASTPLIVPTLASLSRLF